MKHSVKDQVAAARDLRDPAAAVEVLAALVEKMRVERNALLRCCRAASGAYEALKAIGADKHLPGYTRCVRVLEAVLDRHRDVCPMEGD